MNDDIVLHGIDHDASLVMESLRLTPAERLAELDAMIDFVVAGRRAMDEQVHRNPREPRTTRG